MELLDPGADNATIRLKQIMIEDASDWDVTRNSSTINQSNVTDISQTVEEDVVTIDEEVTVTFY